MTDSSVSAKNAQKTETSLEAISLHELAKACWGDQLDYQNQTTENIIAHRKVVVEKIPNTFSGKLPKIQRAQLVEAVMLIQRGYHEALVCTRRHRYHAFRRLKTNPMATGSYSLRNFIDPRGHFDDLLWARSFVDDESQPVLCRFEIACFYCFEDAVSEMWHSALSKGRHPYPGGYRDIWARYSLFVAIWVCRLEGMLDKLVDAEDAFAEGFHVGGFIKSMDRANEHGARYFWARCSDEEKDDLSKDILSGYAFYEDLSIRASEGYAGYVNFIYSLLNDEQKRILFSTSFSNEDPHVYSCLLLSQFHESVLNYIVSFTRSRTGIRTYAIILTALAKKLRELPISDYKRILKALWTPLSADERTAALEMEGLFLCSLTHVMDMDLLRWIVQPLPPAVKRKILLEDFNQAGLSALDLISKSGDFDAMLRYLLLFLVDDPGTGGWRLPHSTATDLLDRFTEERAFTNWFIEKISESERREVANVLCSLQGSLSVLHHLMERVEETNGDGAPSTERIQGNGEGAQKTPERSSGDTAEGTTSRNEQK